MEITQNEKNKLLHLLHMSTGFYDNYESYNNTMSCMENINTSYKNRIPRDIFKILLKHAIIEEHINTIVPEKMLNIDSILIFMGIYNDLINYNIYIDNFYYALENFYFTFYIQNIQNNRNIQCFYEFDRDVIHHIRQNNKNITLRTIIKTCDFLLELMQLENEFKRKLKENINHLTLGYFIKFYEKK